MKRRVSWLRLTFPLGEYLQRRIDNADRGINYVEPIIVNKVDKLYNWDLNNFQPRIGIAWSPNLGDNFIGKLFGREGKSVFRGGFAITNDYFGQQLAVTFNSQNTLGFASSQTTAANTFNTTTNPPPLFTGWSERPLTADYHGTWRSDFPATTTL